MHKAGFIPVFIDITGFYNSKNQQQRALGYFVRANTQQKPLSFHEGLIHNPSLLSPPFRCESFAMSKRENCSSKAAQKPKSFPKGRVVLHGRVLHSQRTQTPEGWRHHQHLPGAVRSCLLRISISGSVQGQIEQGLEQPGILGGVPALSEMI